MFRPDLCSLGMAWAAVLRTYGDMSDAASLMANIMMGTMMVTLMLDSTRRALARISWLGSWIRGYNYSHDSIMWLHTAELKGVRGISFIWTLEGIFGPIWHFCNILSVYWAFSCITISIFSILCTVCCKFILRVPLQSKYTGNMNGIPFPDSGNRLCIWFMV